MNIDFNYVDLLTQNQKKELSNAVFQKLLTAIEQIEISKTGKLNVTKMLNDELKELFNDGNIFYDGVDLSRVGEAIITKVIGKLSE